MSANIPVYKGMTVSSSAVAQATVEYNTPNDKDKEDERPYYGDYHEKKEDIRQENPFEESSQNGGYGHRPIEEEIKSSLTVVGGKENIYCSGISEEIYITVAIDNPDDYEILSFTLNGKKYSSYMFEEGSDMENLILKVNVKDLAGIVEYTIDAIKYIDGEDVKDVKMDGEKTVVVGVYTEDQIDVDILETSIGFGEIEVRASITDRYGLIEYSNGGLKAVVYDGEKLLDAKELQISENAITFDGLLSGRVYQYAIVAFYDNFSGNGFAGNIIYEEAFRTKAIVAFDGIEVTENGISFAFHWAEEWKNKNLSALALYANGEKVKDLQLDDTTVDGLLSATTYELQATYIYKNTPQVITLTFTTLRAKLKAPLKEYEIIRESGIFFNETMNTSYVHEGVDFRANAGAEVYSVLSGIVESIITDILVGTEIMIDHGNGLKTLYRFITPIEGLEIGDEVQEGEVIATIAEAHGNEYKDGPHLHFEVIESNANVALDKSWTDFY